MEESEILVKPPVRADFGADHRLAQLVQREGLREERANFHRSILANFITFAPRLQILLPSSTRSQSAAIRNGRESALSVAGSVCGFKRPRPQHGPLHSASALCRIRTNMAILMQTDSHSVSNSKGGMGTLGMTPRDMERGMGKEGGGILFWRGLVAN